MQRFNLVEIMIKHILPFVLRERRMEMRQKGHIFDDAYRMLGPSTTLLKVLGKHMKNSLTKKMLGLCASRTHKACARLFLKISKIILCTNRYM